MKENITQKWPVSDRRRRSQLGALTITYLAPYSVAPTLAQQAATPKNVVVATVNTTAAGDTSAVITHDFSLSASEISQGFPMMRFTSTDGSEITSPWYESTQASNFSIINRAGVGAGGTVKVFIERPTTSYR